MMNMMLNQNPVEQSTENTETVSNIQALPPMTLTVEDLQRELNISRNTAYALTDRKDFPVFRIGKRKLINREKLQEWMDRQCGIFAAA